ncbi:MAG: hypothetical protein LBS89_00055 [Zoogloeaceae bacterium]|nr:hypothetical protein [Zoogloeaceae bacterium]
MFWLLLAVFLQQASLPCVALAGWGLLLAGTAARRRWRALLRRTLILLLTLFLVFAYGVPGATPWNVVWLPSVEGVWEAALHVLRLTVFLGSLAWLLAALSHQALMGGLWFLLRPLQSLGLPMDRSVTRLSLVLECLENTPAGIRQNWRQWLTPPPSEAPPEPVKICLPPWRSRDSLFLAGACLLLGGLLWRA